MVQGRRCLGFVCVTLSERNKGGKDGWLLTTKSNLNYKSVCVCACGFMEQFWLRNPAHTREGSTSFWEAVKTLWYKATPERSCIF